MAIKAKMVLIKNQGRCEGWMREMLLPIPPFPGLGIRIDTYEMLNVEKVMLEHDGHDVTCFVGPEGPERPDRKPINAEEFGFQPIGDVPQSLASPENLWNIETMQQRAKKTEKRALQAGLFCENIEGSWWSKTIEIPFAPFVGLEIGLDSARTLTVWSIVIGDRYHDVTCLVKPVPFTSAECEALGFEKALYPY